MRVLSVRQPWASLIMIGAKPFEFRTWPLRVTGQRWAVHASKSRPRREELEGIFADIQSGYTSGMDAEAAAGLVVAALNNPSVLPCGVILGTVLAGDPVRATTIWADADPEIWANPVSAPMPLAHPIPATGRLGWWQYDGPLS